MSVSITQETWIKAVSIFIHLPKLFSTKNETLAGVTYPIPPNTPACKLAPVGAYVDGANDLASPKSQSQLLRYVCGANPQGASNYQDAINTEQADEWQNVNIKAVTIHERCVHQQSNDTNSRNERELANKPHCFRYVRLYQSVLEVQRWNTLFALPAMEGREVIGSTPIRYIPAAHYHTLLSDPGAGNFFDTTLTHPAPHIFIRSDKI